MRDDPPPAKSAGRPSKAAGQLAEVEARCAAVELERDALRAEAEALRGQVAFWQKRRRLLANQLRGLKRNPPWGRP